ncbi:IS1380 family transposase [Pontiellaceae bacterium B12219]|nr:IS1380 family transposase [Pontiellaceae bacterium B12219]
MTEYTQTHFNFPSCKSRKITVDFSGGNITSNGGVLLLRQADRKLGLTRAAARLIPDDRRKASVKHSIEQMFRQRVYALGCGEEDLNDHDELRQDIALQTAVGCDKALASPSTRWRFENSAQRQAAVDMNALLVEQFIRSHTVAPKEIILDFDATDDVVHGDQDGRFFHGYYDHYCFLPLYVFCGSQLLCAYLRPSKIDGAKHAWAILALLTKRVREVWPEMNVIFRGDSGFCRWKMLRWCESHGVDYIVGIGGNARLKQFGARLIEQSKAAYEQTEEKQRLFSEFNYAAATWDRERRVIIKAEHTILGANTRFILTSLEGDAQELYDEIYCARGDMENRIKEQQLDLYADRTSCHNWWPNQLRLMLSSFTYVLFEHIRRTALKITRLANATSASIRNKLIRIGAVTVRNTRRIRFHMSTAYPRQELFALVTARLQ